MNKHKQVGTYFVPPEGYCTIEKASELIGMSVHNIRYLASKNYIAVFTCDDLKQLGVEIVGGDKRIKLYKILDLLEMKSSRDEAMEKKALTRHKIREKAHKISDKPIDKECDKE